MLFAILKIMTGTGYLQGCLWLLRFFLGAGGFCFFSEKKVIGALAGGIAFLLCPAKFGFGYTGLISLEGAVIFCYLGILLVMARSDWKTRIIRNRFHVMILLLAVPQLFLVPEHGIGDRLVGALIVSVPMLMLTLAAPGAFGGGDIKLMAVSGVFLGMDAIVCAMFFGLLVGAGYAACMLATGRLKRNDQFALGPFLAFGLSLAALWGDRIHG